jgi:hypothetical protein
MILETDPTNSRKFPTPLKAFQGITLTFQNLQDQFLHIHLTIGTMSNRTPVTMKLCNNKQEIIKKITTKKGKELLQQIKPMAITLETRLPTQKKDLSAGIKKISFKRVSKTVNKA